VESDGAGTCLSLLVQRADVLRVAKNFSNQTPCLRCLRRACVAVCLFMLCCFNLRASTTRPSRNQKAVMLSAAKHLLRVKFAEKSRLLAAFGMTVLESSRDPKNPQNSSTQIGGFPERLLIPGVLPSLRLT
jgi:hypothetical protein